MAATGAMVVFLMDEGGRPYQAHVYGVDVRGHEALERRARFVKEMTLAPRLGWAHVEMDPEEAAARLEAVSPCEVMEMGPIRMDRPELMFATVHRFGRGRGSMTQIHWDRAEECNYYMDEYEARRLDEEREFMESLPF